MEKITIELENQDISKIGEQAIIDFYQTMAVEQLYLPNLNVFVTGVDSSSLNVVIDTNSGNKITSETVRSIIAFFKSNNVPWTWFVTNPAAGRVIASHGFSLSYTAAGMYLNLTNFLPTAKTDLIIKEQKDDLRDWIESVQEGFPSEDNGEAYRELNANLLTRREVKFRHFTAYYSGESVASATLFFSKNYVMLHNLATKTKFRQMGIGSSLTLHLLSEAKKYGYQHCFLDSSDVGLSMYRKLGFKVYSVTSEYEIS